MSGLYCAALLNLPSRFWSLHQAWLFVSAALPNSDLFGRFCRLLELGYRFRRDFVKPPILWFCRISLFRSLILFKFRAFATCFWLAQIYFITMRTALINFLPNLTACKFLKFSRPALLALPNANLSAVILQILGLNLARKFDADSQGRHRFNAKNKFIRSCLPGKPTIAKSRFKPNLACLRPTPFYASFIKITSLKSPRANPKFTLT